MIFTCALLASAFCLPPAAPAADFALDQLTWLQGCWEGRLGAAQYAEQWMKPAGGCLLGMSRTVKDGRTVDYEFLRIWQDHDGKTYYTAKPSRQPEATFTLVRASDKELVFENLDHDFPQRIIYRRGDQGRLTARIEGTRDGQSRGVDFPMQRVKCD